MASTVGTVGRRTGVEGGIRWALHRTTSSGDTRAGKRRKVSEEDEVRGAGTMDIEKALNAQDPTPLSRTISRELSKRRSSSLSRTETLPAYDDQRSPRYEENGPEQDQRPAPPQRTPSGNGTWQQRLVISTSGLGIAMREESLRSLKYCLSQLTWANGRLASFIVMLKDLLAEWERSYSQQPEPPSTTSVSEKGPEQAPTSDERAKQQSHLAQQIQKLKTDILQTLSAVVEVVSKYAGGALPDNARNLVKRHLTSLPQRFMIATSSARSSPSSSTGSSSERAANGSANSETVTSAQRVLVLAQEGLDMMGQVSGVVNDTLYSAESWCERLGRRGGRTDGSDEAPMPAIGPYPADTKTIEDEKEQLAKAQAADQLIALERARQSETIRLPPLEQTGVDKEYKMMRRDVDMSGSV